VALWAKEASDSSARQLSPSILKEPTLVSPGKPGNLKPKGRRPKPTLPKELGSTSGWGGGMGTAGGE